MHTFIHGAVIISAFSITACATTKPPTELVDARTAYGVAETAASKSAPTELHAARVALDDAEASFVKAPTAVDVKDRAYIAQRRAEFASARAGIYASHAERDAANARLQALGATAITQLREAKESLSAAKADARDLTSDLSASKAETRASDQRASGLSSDLNNSKENAADLTTKLAVEKQARIDSEARLTSTLQAMHDLQSVKQEPRGLVITLSGQVLFASGQSVLLPAARSALDNVAEALKATPNRAITVGGYTDSQGTPGSNMELSQRRGDSVRVYLISRGIDNATIHSTGFGQESPVADNSTVEGRANNRRVEIVLAPAAAT